MKKKNKINCNTIFASEDIILEKKTNVITSLLLLIVSAVMTSIIWHYISNNIIFLRVVHIFLNIWQILFELGYQPKTSLQSQNLPWG